MAGSVTAVSPVPSTKADPGYRRHLLLLGVCCFKTLNISQACLIFLAVTSQLPHFEVPVNYNLSFPHMHCCRDLPCSGLGPDIFFWINVQYLKLVTLKCHHVRYMLRKTENFSRRVCKRWDMVVASREAY